MEKKHRDIVVDGQHYGWIASYQGKDIIVKVFKDKKNYFTKSVRLPEVTPADVAEYIQEYNKNLAHIELGETLDKEWTAFLRKIPWDGYGRTIEESNIIFDGKRKAWMKKMVKKHNCSMALLLLRYKNE